MTSMAEISVDGDTLQEYLAVTAEELAAKMSSKALLKAAQDEKHKFASWMAKSQWPNLSNLAAEQVCSFLQTDLAGIFAGAWTQYSELRKCARESLENPKSTLAVALVDHDFTYEMEPAVEVMINQVKVATIPFTIGVTFTVKGLELFLRKGAVYQVASGGCDTKAEIHCARNLIWERLLAGTNLPGRLHLTRPIVIEKAIAEEVASRPR
jgi:hypothetical protein